MTGEVIEGLTVTQDTGSNMAVRVQAGSARIPTGTAPANYGFFVAVDTTGSGEQVTITTANGSNPRRDLIVAYVDLAVTPSSGTPNNPNNMLKLAAVAGTPNASPVDPNGAAIQSAIGASNPYIILARVAVGTSVTQITTANCTDLRTMVLTQATKINNASMFAAWANVATTIAASFVPTKVTFGTEEYDKGSEYDTATSRFTAATPGYRKFDAAYQSGSGASGEFFTIYLYKNGTLFKTGSGIAVQGANSVFLVLSTPPIWLNTGDYVEIFAAMNSGGAKSTVTGQEKTYFGGYLVSVTQ